MTKIQRIRAQLVESRTVVDMLRESGRVPYATLEQERMDGDRLRAALVAEKQREVERLLVRLEQLAAALTAADLPLPPEEP